MDKERERLSVQPKRADISVALPGRERLAVSTTERRLLIGEKPLLGSSERAFVGANPLTDRLQTEKVFDVEYVTKERDACSSAERAEIEEKVKRVLSYYGMDDLCCDALLNRYHDDMRKLASRTVFDCFDGTERRHKPLSCHCEL